MEFIDSVAVEEDIMEGVGDSEEEDCESDYDRIFINNMEEEDDGPPPPNPYLEMYPKVRRHLRGAIARIEGRVKACSVYIIIISG